MEIDINKAVFYKHLRSSTGSRKIIDEGTIKFTNPSEFNDPFDCKYKVESSFLPTSTELKHVQEAVLGKSHPPHERIRAQRKMQNLHMSGLGNFHELFSDIGICCLNRNPLSILMWSHYGDSHKGFMVEMGFKEPNQFNESELSEFVPINVTYQDDFPHITQLDKSYIMKNSINDSNRLNTVKKALLTKSSEWGYECEYRVIDLNKSKQLNSKNGYIRNYPRRQILNSVIAGLNISKEDMRELKKSVEIAENDLNRAIPIYQVEIIEGMYKLHVPNHPFLDKKHWDIT